MLISRRFVVVAALSGAGLGACTSNDWPTYRNDHERSGDQRSAGALSDPARVPESRRPVVLEVPTNRRAFRASPIVHRGRVYHRQRERVFLCARRHYRHRTLAVPSGDRPALTAYIRRAGVAYGGSQITVRGFWSSQRTVLDRCLRRAGRSLAPGYGSGRLFALNASTGAVVWKSATTRGG